MGDGVCAIWGGVDENPTALHRGSKVLCGLGGKGDMLILAGLAKGGSCFVDDGESGESGLYNGEAIWAGTKVDPANCPLLALLLRRSERTLIVRGVSSSSLPLLLPFLVPRSFDANGPSCLLLANHSPTAKRMRTKPPTAPATIWSKCKV